MKRRSDIDEEAEVFYGEVINTRDVITFQGKSVEELKKSLKTQSKIIWNFAASEAKNRTSLFRAMSFCIFRLNCIIGFILKRNAPVKL